MPTRFSKNDLIPSLLEACPDFEPKWQEFQDEWQNENNPPLNLCLLEFSLHLIEKIETNHTENFAVIFTTLDELLEKGDHEVQELITIGILESLQNDNHYSSSTPEAFLPYLKQETRKAWDQLNGFWESENA